MERKVLIATPSYSGATDARHETCIAQMSAECHALGWKLDRCTRTTDSVLPRARNVLLGNFMASGATDLLMIDADTWCDPGSFTRIMMHNVDLVGGAYPHRGEIDGFVFRPFNDRLFFDDKTGLMEVDACATGFLRITRAVVERLIAAHMDEWYHDITAPGMQIFNLFDFKLDEHMYWSEDYVFCRKWRAVGGQSWIDPELMLHHKGEKVYSGRLGDWLRDRYRDLQAAGKIPGQGDTLTEAEKLLAAE